MRKTLILSTIFVISACGTNEDGSSKFTYSSCKITSTDALFSSDRNKDLLQCWNADGNGYESKGDAMQWCERTVNTYMSNNYIFGHSISYAVESTNCK